jgi:hypothetical protein
LERYAISVYISRVNAHLFQGSLFGPYTPLQQLDILADFGTKSYIVGSTNSLLLQQRDRYSDILINLDEDTINITSPSLKAALQLSTPDRRWIDFITQNVNDTWDDANPSRPKTMGYVGSEEFIRVQFEEYLLSLISSVKYHAHLAKHAHNPRMLLPEIEGDPSADFSPDFIDAWSRTENFAIWNAHTDSHLFDIVEPKHPCAGGLTIDDIQRRITQQVQDLHWDERFAQGREVLGRNLAAGKEKASTLFNKLYADMEALREAQRKKAEEGRAQQQQQQQYEKEGGGLSWEQQQVGGGGAGGEKNAAAAAGQGGGGTVGSKAGAFVNSWAAWAGEKRRAAWGKPTTTTATASGDGTTASTPGSTRNSTSGDGSSGGGARTSGWGASWGRNSGGKNRASLAGPGSGGYGYETVLSDRDTTRASVSSAGGRSHYSDRAAEQGLLNRRSRGDSVVSGESVLFDGDGDGDGDRGVGGEERAAAVVSSPVRKPVPRAMPIREGAGSGAVLDANTPTTINGNGAADAASKSEGGKDEDGDGNGDRDAVSGKRDANRAADEEGLPKPLGSPPSSAGLPDAATAEAAQVQEVWDKR